MDKFKEIRPVVLGILKKDNKILVNRGFDKVTKEEFYRPIGGGIEFLETSEDALKREFQEELNIAIEVKEFLGIEENIFTYNGKKAHELILFYNVSIKNEDYKEEYVVEGNVNARWIDINKFRNKELKLYPEQTHKYLN